MSLRLGQTGDLPASLRGDLPGDVSEREAGTKVPAIVQIGAARVIIGAVAWARPTLLLRLLGADRVTAERLAWTIRMVGARDAALGAGTLVASRGKGWRTWALAGVVTDAADAVTFAGALRRRQVNVAFGLASVVSAVGAVAMGVDALRRGRSRQLD